MSIIIGARKPGRPIIAVAAYRVRLARPPVIPVIEGVRVCQHPPLTACRVKASRVWDTCPGGRVTDLALAAVVIATAVAWLKRIARTSFNIKCLTFFTGVGWVVSYINIFAMGAPKLRRAVSISAGLGAGMA